jgi:predicted transposase YbfD/YdcC
LDRAFFPWGDPKKEFDIKVIHRAEKGHGRFETRQLEVTSALEGYLTWPGVVQVMKMTRTRSINGRESAETVYGITSLSADEASPEDLFEYWRNHWRIENRLHYIRDVALREDFCRCRTRSIPEILAALRNLVIFALRRKGVENIVAGIEQMGEAKNQAIGMIHLPRIK